jgi:soluble lytic murein transglycosylase-like protein
MVKVTLLRVLIHLCSINHIDPFLAEAIIKVESQWDSHLVGLANERGLFQLNPTSFPTYSLVDLKDSRLNIKLGVEYLVKMKRECVHQDNNSFILCYNRGVAGAQKVKNYKTDSYYKKVMIEYDKLVGDNYNAD